MQVHRKEVDLALYATGQPFQLFAFGDIIAQPVLGGLHHRYARI
jgi:hypothetical protein